MELALYCPVYGYYEAEKDTIGRRGDYYTSVSVGPLFGELLAYRMAEWLEEADPRTKTGLGDSFRLLGQLVEAGAHTGQLANDILRWLKEHRPKLFQHLEYWIIEPSERRRERQKKTLAEYSNKVHWAGTLAEFGSRSEFIPPRIIFANELLDAMPVHRFGWDASPGSWFEWGVNLKGQEFVWTRLSAPTIEVPKFASVLSERLQKHLPDGYVVESSPAAEAWWCAAAGTLRSGRLLTFDYGKTLEELLIPENTWGTLRAYSGHHATRELLAEPGQKDITAHVNFSGIAAAGQAAGLVTEALVTQEEFLTSIAAKVWKGNGTFGEWSTSQTRQFQTLIHPNHLGRSFRVLVQQRPAQETTTDIRS